MTAIVLGKSEKADIRLDLAALAEQRLLVQGTSGSGKSGLLRRLLEQSYGLIPQIVIDTEGEFATLRTDFPDFVLAAHEGGDTLAAPHTAAKLARELNALNVSAILDISELDPRHRLEFVANYLTALVNLPRALWKPVLLVVDEAHEFAPENGSAASLLPMERTASKGRKRGIILVCATTRVADLSKSVTALLNNKLIGKTQQDGDVRRAAFELGISSREATTLLRDLKSRNFIGYGGAFVGGDEGTNVALYVSDTKTHPPVMGEIVAPKAPTWKMRQALAKLSDLPKEAEKEIRDLADAKAVIARLERELKAKPAPEIKRVVLDAPCGHEKELQALRAAGASGDELIAELERELDRVAPALRELVGARSTLARIIASAQGTLEASTFDATLVRKPKRRKTQPVPPPTSASAEPRDPASMVGAHVELNGRRATVTSNTITDSRVNKPMQSILDAIAHFRSLGVDPAARSAVAAIAGVVPSSPGFKKNIGLLRTYALANFRDGGDDISLTESGVAAANVPDEIPTLEQFHERWFATMSGAQGNILRELIGRHPNAAPLESFAAASTTPEGFKKNVGILRKMGLIENNDAGALRLTSLLFPEGLS